MADPTKTIDQFTPASAFVAGDKMYGLRGGSQDITFDVKSAVIAEINGVFPPGISFYYMGPTIPAGFLNEDGSVVSKTTYANLWNALHSEKGSVTITIATPAVLTLAAHGLDTGSRVYLTTTGALPTGLTADTNYWAIRIDANTFNLATSLANAKAGTKIATSGSQSGVHSLVYAPWGTSGSSNFLLPDSRSAAKRGAGTPTLFTSNTILTIGQIIDDTIQSHLHGIVPSYLIAASGGGGAGLSGGGGSYTQNGSPIGLPIADALGNGTPRTGPETTGKAIAVNSIIKY